jgi:spermidine synthase
MTGTTGQPFMHWFFFFFFVSGFCSILYELIWLRLAMAQFGVTSALVSIVLSVFMAGLGFGSWASGRLIRKLEGRIGFPALRLYAVVELLIGFSALVVPYELKLGRNLLEQAGISASSAYYLFSGVWITLTLFPWCTCMGATIPVGMLAIRNGFPHDARRSFSLLYLANVLGALMGAIFPLFLIELKGFHSTLGVGATLNFMLAAAAFALSLLPSTPLGTLPAAARASLATNPVEERRLLALLFGTGLTSMGLEVVWIRQFTPFTGTMVYSFASVLSLYLASTYLGSQAYRLWSRRRDVEVGAMWVLLGLFALLPLVTANPRVRLLPKPRLLLGIAPFSALLGFITPMLVDRWSGGDPDRAGGAYALNVVGCILGPLVSGFLLMPLMSERWIMTLWALPWIVVGMIPALTSIGDKAVPLTSWHPARVAYVSTFLALVVILFGRGFEDVVHGHVLRDHTATIIATGDGMRKQLFVNGIAITILTPITKMMAHMPLAFLDHPPQNALVVCFGMGTTYRSLLSWNISSTAVELVPNVPRLFWYYHPDGPQLLQSPLSHVVIDDGRRYLERTSEHYDVITIDPPPPVQAAGSSLLYSKEFYSLIKQRLQPGGVVQQWLPKGDAAIHASVARALGESFPYIRVFRSVTGEGYHFLASECSLDGRSPAKLVQRMPASAVRDMMEWGPQPTPERQFAVVLSRELPLQAMIAEAPKTPALKDDRPINEYYWLRAKALAH